MADEKIVNYKSRKSRSEFTVKGTPTRAFLAASGEAATNPKVLKQIDDVRKGSYDFATVDWMARELEELRKKQEEAERIIREQKIREEAERKAREEAEARAAAEKARLEREKQEAERKAAEAERVAKEAMEREAEARKNQATASVDFPVFQGAAAAVNNGAKTTAPLKKPSKWTDEQKKVNSAILARFAEIIRESLPKHIAGHSDQGYELAATEAAKDLIKAIACGKIDNINVRY